MTFDANDIFKLILGVICGAFVFCMLLVFLFNKSPRGRQKGAIWVVVLFAGGLIWGYIALVGKPRRLASEEARKNNALTQQQMKERYAKGKAIFDERCKSAEEKINRTVEGVDGVLLTNVRGSDMSERNSDPYWPDAGLAQQYGGDSYIRSFLEWEHQQSPPERGVLNTYSKSVRNYLVTQGYSYIDVKEDDDIYRYRLKNPPSSEMSKDLLTKAPARYAVSFENIINPADREYWIAGTTVMITDTKTQELIAKKTWYSFEPGFGSHAGNRQPWRFAITCPENKGWAERAPTRFFVDQILKPKQ